MTKVILPTVQQMRLFEAVARLGSVTRAADEVHLTQPSVSMQVRALEEKIGMPLTEKVGKSLHLTHAGQVVAEASRDVLARLTEMQHTLEDLKGEVAGPLSVAVVSTARYFMPQVMGAFKRGFPLVAPRLTIANRTTLLERIEANADDLYVTGQPPTDLSVEKAEFMENVIVFAARPDHPLAGQARIPLSRIAQEEVLRREPGSGTRRAVDTLFREAGLALPTQMEFDDTEAIKQGVISGLGIASLPLMSLRLELAAGELVLLDVEGFPLRRPWYAVHRSGKRLSNAARAFLELLPAQAQALSQAASAPVA